MESHMCQTTNQIIYDCIYIYVIISHWHMIFTLFHMSFHSVRYGMSEECRMCSSLFGCLCDVHRPTMASGISVAQRGGWIGGPSGFENQYVTGATKRSGDLSIVIGDILYTINTAWGCTLNSIASLLHPQWVVCISHVGETDEKTLHPCLHSIWDCIVCIPWSPCRSCILPRRVWFKHQPKQRHICLFLPFKPVICLGQILLNNTAPSTENQADSTK